MSSARTRTASTALAAMRQSSFSSKKSSSRNMNNGGLAKSNETAVLASSTLMPPPRTAAKKKPETLAKEKAPRPTKKLAKEIPDEVPSLAGLSRNLINSARKNQPVSSRGMSSSPHSVSPVQLDIDNAPNKSAKKPDASVKSRLAAPGTLPRRIREPTRTATLEHGSSRNIGTISSRGIISLATPARSKDVQMSKSGVEMDGSHPPEKAPSTPGSDACKTINEGDMAVENLPPSQNDSQLYLQIQSLDQRLREISEELTMTVHEKESAQQKVLEIAESYNAALQQLQTVRAENHAFLAEKDDSVKSHQNALDEIYRLKMQVDDVRMHHDILQSEQVRLRDDSSALLAERDQQNQRLQCIVVEYEQAQMQISSLRTDITDALGKAQQAEERLAKISEEKDIVKREFSTVKKKRQVEYEKVKEELAHLEKKMQTKVNEAESWRAVADLKSEEIRKLQKDLEDAREVVERHQFCEAEINRQSLQITSLEAKAARSSVAERELRELLEEKENELKALRRQSVMLTQEKDTLKFRLEEVTEHGERRRPRHSTMLVSESLTSQLDSLAESDDL